MNRPGVAVVGIGRTAYSTDSGVSTATLAADASRAALVDSGLRPADVDGFCSFHVNDSTPALAVAHAIGIDDLAWCVDGLGGGNLAAAVVAGAAAAIDAGLCTTAVVFRALNGRSGRRFGRAGASTAGGTRPAMRVPGEAQFGAPHGYLVAPQWMAVWAQRHQAVHGSTCEDLGQIAITQRAHAARNDHAVAREPLTMDRYLDSRWINEPLRVFDCAFEVDGAAALVLTTLDRARDLAQPPVRILSAADAQANGGSWDQWPDQTSMFSKLLAPRLWGRAGIGPADIDVACIYDCFTYTVMAVMEDLGFFPKGGAGEFFGSGAATYGGSVVVNPHGGLLSEGYIHGMNHHYEAVLQLRGQGGARQVPDASVALVTAGAGPYGGAVLYEGTP